MHLDAILTEPDYSKDRTSRRRVLKLSVGVQVPTGNWTSVVIRNIGSGGLLLEAETVALEIGDSITVELPGKGIVQAKVAWVSAPFFGCRIDGSLSTAEIAAALLQSEPADNRQAYIPNDTAPHNWGKRDVRIDPELNFAVAFGLSTMFWALIALVAYLVY